MQSSPSSKDPDDHQGKSRLDRELEEILSRNDNIRHLPHQPAVHKPRSLKPPALSHSGVNLPPRVRNLLASPVLLALALGIVAVFISDVSRLLASLLSFAAVACIIWPMLQRFRGPTSASGSSETKMWRGRVYEVGKPTSSTRSPIDSLREWWESRRSRP